MAPQDTYPNPMTLQADKSQWWLSAGLMGLFAGVCGITGLIQRQADIAYWLFIALFAALALLCLWFALSNKSNLTLTREGFSFQTPFGSQGYRWDDIDRFGYGTMNRRDTVFFKFASTYTGKKPPLSGAARFLVDGYEMYLPNTYGMTSEQLAGLMTLWRSRRFGNNHIVENSEITNG
jgi:hypothetical protein